MTSKGSPLSLNLPAENPGVAAEPVRPKGMAQHGNMRIGKLFLLGEEPAQ